MKARLRRSAMLLAGSLIPLVCLMGRPASAAPADPLTDAFTHAAAAYDVPRDLLVAVGYAETHLDGHRGEPSASGGYGVMHLVSNPTVHALEQAAKLTAQPVETLKSDDAANVAGGAAVLRAHADELGLDATARKDAGKWYAAVAEYGNASSPEVARLYADTVYDLLAKGVTAATPNGTVTVKAQAVTPERGTYAQAPDLNAPRLAAAVDYPGAKWVAASSSNYTVSNRPASNAIDRIVIHVTQGSYAGTISWFQNPAAQVSAHYVVRSSDGDITQMVREKDRAWHARDWNSRSVGIEHEGYVDNASWFTDAMYRASAALTRNIADRYNIPKDRTHIVGHVEVPGNDHTDPGPYWDWAKYMQYVGGSNGGVNPYTPQEVCGSGYNVIDSAALGTAGTVYLLYNNSNGYNCVTTIKSSSLGTATATSAYLEVQGKTRVTDSGNFTYYAGPVRAAAADKCVKWGGKAGSSAYDSPFEHCG
ncbi:N-acetylmuramoyl-L-alanine amidase [Streptosporangium sp. NBC_01756]|uniref:N-acetylmuramoyl-L-alanine amidase n=1 Tax=Streptosporangium sp. NBC_01756 TaxID=2975950 RepID=UPI002DD96483|nr:peptidoglycan recognition family protein [Streptosporangium sp. NBC_01756]WSC86983.1 N-acetylmuramoyl-L-alanine amidase [Streptosporangium sp. NBC_01756]